MHDSLSEYLHLRGEGVKRRFFPQSLKSGREEKKMKKHIFPATVAALLCVVAVTEAAVPCKSNSDCDARQYCAKATGKCDAEGTCQGRPEICPLVWMPVCGCDGRTYGNACEAAAAGVSVNYEGECRPAQCSDNADCAQSEYCRKESCDAPSGTCEPRPQGCPEIYSPVCGCDGKTYGNECEAASAGVNVAYEGECSRYCGSNIDCGANEYCFFETCALETGVCRERPQVCPDVWDPVCGCDGKTYGNSCEAAAVGVSVDYEGECNPSYCRSNEMCAPEEYCLFEICEVESGICTPRPQVCPDVWDPVCGCDGVTYSNVCYAAMVGVSVDYFGECVTGICNANNDCAAEEYCAKAAGDCDGEGACSTRPEVCPMIWDPVCGCDGRTYSNSCFAAMAGVNVDYSGECQPVVTPCRANADCEIDQYCAKDAGDCSGEGVCQPRPGICPDIWDPVCGCDGATYSNECYAARAGVNVDYAGQCEPVVTPCGSNEDCDPDSYCAKEPGDCDGVGACQPRPQVCLDIWDPVCGCDGRTYSNSCYAATAGVNVNYRGECEPVVTPCSSNKDCSPEGYCAKASGDCDGQGACQARPEACIAVWDPVCGCDGVTYSNTCYAAMAGVSVDYQGQCEPDVTPCDSSADCDAADYCAKSPGDCDGEGTCQSRPQACPAVWDPVCGCDGSTYSNACYGAMAGVSVNYEGQCLPAGPTILMREPKVAPDDVHTGPSGIALVRILWSEAVVFSAGDIAIVNEDGSAVPFAVAGSSSEIMTINFNRILLYDRYTITIADSVVGADTGNSIDGDKNGAAGGDAVIVMEHRDRGDFDNSNLINGIDFAAIARKWLEDFN